MSPAAPTATRPRPGPPERRYHGLRDTTFEKVATHVSSILTKLGLQDRVQAAIFALRHQTDGRENQP
jgi:hypothetical protein